MISCFDTGDANGIPLDVSFPALEVLTICDDACFFSRLVNMLSNQHPMVARFTWSVRGDFFRGV